MTLPSSGTITIAQIAAEFGGDAPHSLSEYYRGGGLVPTNNTNVPTSGTITLSDFYSAVNQVSVTASSASSVNLQTLFNNAASGSWTSTVPKIYTVGASVVLGITTVPASMGGTLTINHSGDIQGTGGAGGTFSGTKTGSAGGTAMTVQSTGVTINMLSGSTLSGGGGGGGVGGGGGTGTRYQCAGNGSGACANAGGCSGDENSYYFTKPGGSGGAGGVGAGYNQSQANGAAGGSGQSGGNGNTGPSGAGGTGGNGGTFGVAGATGATGAGGGGDCGSSGSGGSGGGAAGRAVTFSGVSAYTIIGTNSGTIHGAFT